MGLSKGCGMGGSGPNAGYSSWAATGVESPSDSPMKTAVTSSSAAKGQTQSLRDIKCCFISD